MSNPTTEYTTQAIDPAVLSVLDVELDGKVVSAQDWKTLWQLVFNRINHIDAFCLKVEDLRVSLEQSRQEMFDVAHRVDVKYAALEKSFVHYGTDAPTNEHVKFWVQPVADVNSNLLVTYPALQKEFSAKIGELIPIADTLAVELYRLELTNPTQYIVERYHVNEAITSLELILPNGTHTISQNWLHTIPKDANITVVYARGEDVPSASTEGTVVRRPVRVVVYSDTPWILPLGPSGVPEVTTAYDGYYIINANLTWSPTGDRVEDIVDKFIRAADMTFARTSKITLDSSKWTGSGPYEQVITGLTNITANSKIDLTPTPAQLHTFYNNGQSFIIENKNRLIKAYCIGTKPTTSYTISVSITEVTT